MLIEYTTDTVFYLLLIFTRIGAALMFLPGFGETYINSRMRLLIALIISMILIPVLRPVLPAVPANVPALFIMLFTEATIGIYIGLIGRMLQSILHVAGMVIAFQSSLASALLFDATQGSQGSVIGNLMTLLGVVLLFTTNLHHMLLTGITQSYDVFAAGVFLPVADIAEFAARTLSQGFLIAFGMSAPLIIIGLCLYLTSGIIARLMPSMQVFFVIIPAQILISFFVLATILSASMMWYLRHFEETMRYLLGQ